MEPAAGVESWGMPAGGITEGAAARQSLPSNVAPLFFNVALGAGVLPFELNELCSYYGKGDRAALRGSYIICYAKHSVKLKARANDIIDSICYNNVSSLIPRLGSTFSIP